MPAGKRLVRGYPHPGKAVVASNSGQCHLSVLSLSPSETNYLYRHTRRCSCRLKKVTNRVAPNHRSKWRRSALARVHWRYSRKPCNYWRTSTLRNWHCQYMIKLALRSKHDESKPKSTSDRIFSALSNRFCLRGISHNQRTSKQLAYVTEWSKTKCSAHILQRFVQLKPHVEIRQTFSGSLLFTHSCYCHPCFFLCEERLAILLLGLFILYFCWGRRNIKLLIKWKRRRRAHENEGWWLRWEEEVEGHEETRGNYLFPANEMPIIRL